MALYFVEYDLRKTRNYQPFWDELARFSAVRVLRSLWCFKRGETSAGGLRDYFKRYIDADDGLCVMEVTDWGTYNTEKTPNDLK